MHLRHEQAAEVKGRGKPKDLSKKAILLSGPPGIGKTSSASIISRCWAMCFTCWPVKSMEEFCAVQCCALLCCAVLCFAVLPNVTKLTYCYST